MHKCGLTLRITCRQSDDHAKIVQDILLPFCKLPFTTVPPEASPLTLFVVSWYQSLVSTIEDRKLPAISSRGSSVAFRSLSRQLVQKFYER